MATFYTRSKGYAAGVMVLFLGFVLFCVGFGSRHWSATSMKYMGYHGDYQSFHNHNGLWVACRTDTGRPICSSLAREQGIQIPAWFKVVQTFQCVSLLFGASAVCCVFVYNCPKTNHPRSRAVEILAAISAIIGLLSLGVYGLEQARMAEVLREKASNIFPPDLDLDIVHDHVSSSFFISLLGLIVILIAVVVIAVFNKVLLVKNVILPAIVLSVLSPDDGNEGSLNTAVNATQRHSPNVPASDSNYPTNQPSHAALHTLKVPQETYGINIY